MKDNLAEMNEIFNNKTFTYRINGFAHACGMKELDTSDRKTIKDGKVYYGYNQVLFNKKRGRKEGSDTNYYIVVNTSNNNPYGYGVTISGYYDDLNFSFTNYYDLNKDLDRKIWELPFNITLYKNIDKDIFYLNIETVCDMQTKFTISKSREYKDKTVSSNISFYANILDFSNILKLVKSFVYNPKLMYTTYNEIIKSRKIVLNSNEINKGIMQDEALDKPVSKVIKKVNKIIDTK